MFISEYWYNQAYSKFLVKKSEIFGKHIRIQEMHHIRSHKTSLQEILLDSNKGYGGDANNKFIKYCSTIYISISGIEPGVPKFTDFFRKFNFKIY